jgi:hypothetical protein
MRGDVCATYLSGFLVYEDEEYSFGIGWQLRSSVIDARAGFYAAECDPHKERADLVSVREMLGVSGSSLSLNWGVPIGRRRRHGKLGAGGFSPGEHYRPNPQLEVILGRNSRLSLEGCARSGRVGDEP